MYDLLTSLGSIFFSHNDLKIAFNKFRDPRVETTLRQSLAYRLLRVANAIGLLPGMHRAYMERVHSIIQNHPAISTYDSEILHLLLNRIYDLPDVEIDKNRKPTLNVLVPAFNFNSISAGFFGVFQVARFLHFSGYPVRLVLFDNFLFNYNECKKKLLEYPGMERLFDELEVEYIGERKSPLKVSPNDNCVATVWYSAHFAQKICNHLGGRRFLYLIQDYETNFFSGGSLFALSEETYEMDYIALFSTRTLRDFFVDYNICGFRSRDVPHVYFNNACSASLPSKSVFIAARPPGRKRRLVFYSRPIVDRNMFELAALSLATAYEQNIFDPKEWDCYGMGLGEGRIQLTPAHSSLSLPRMTLRQYQDCVSGFDICLTLMASPHPSLIPMDLAGSGCIVVTNTFKTKTDTFLRSISRNIIPASPSLPSILSSLREARDRSEDLDLRYENAKSMDYPLDWADSFSNDHISFFREHLEFTPAPVKKWT